MRYKDNIFRLFTLLRKGMKILIHHGPIVLFKRLNNKIHNKIHAKISKAKPSNINEQKHEFGINVAGYLSTESGVGEMGRCLAKNAKAAEIPFTVNNFTISPQRKENNTFSELYEESNPYPINIIAVNAEQVPVFYEHKGEDYFKDKYNIGYWAWELPTFPDIWLDNFKYLDEIWTISNYCAESIRKATDKPVKVIWPSIKIKRSKKFDRNHFKIPENKFVFLFIFDFYSIFERKNPLTLIKAFKEAFKDNEEILLIIKCSNASINETDFNNMKKECGDHPIRIIDKYLLDDEIYSLISICDCYVSLHRCEGFGLTIAEAMYFGKPVIATNYSSNTDFMNENNSFPVRYDLVKLKKDYPPYKKGNVWAEPETKHVSELMRYVFENKEEAKKIGKNARRDIKKQLSPENIGQIMKQRIEEIKSNKKL